MLLIFAASIYYNEKMHKGLKIAIDAVGGQCSLARLIKTSQANIHAWLHKTKNGPPAEYVKSISDVSKVPMWDIRPDIWPSPSQKNKNK